MTRADGWIATGREHERQGQPCQDSLAFGSRAGLSLACVSDGCSQAPGSELGAWALSRSALALFQEGADFFSLPAHEALSLVLERSEPLARALGFDLARAPATLLLLCHDPAARSARALIWGDGYVGRARAGSVELIESKAEREMPFYPAYALEPRAGSAWLDAGGSQALLSPPSMEGATLAQSGREAWISAQPGDLIFVATDGAARAGALSPAEALGEAGLIKSRAGRFLARRMSRARQVWEAQAAADGSRFDFGDDFAIAGVLFDPPSSEAP